MRTKKRKVHLCKKAQVNIFTMIFIIVIFFLLLAGGLGYIVNTMVGVAMTTPELTGIEAFFINNLMLWFILGFVIWVLWSMR